jgi:4a-hydroxytetrahydrobiopterin dehydratase
MAKAQEPVYEAAQVKQRLATELPHWTLADGRLRRSYRTKDWQSSLLAANAVGHLAEAAWHHPELTVSFGALVVTLWTDTAKGVTDKDFALAQKIESVIQWQAAKDKGPLSGPPGDDARFGYIKYD